MSIETWRPSHQGWQRSSPNHSAMAGLQPSNSLFSIARLAVGCYFYDGKPFHLSRTSAKRSRIEVASVSRLASPCKQMAKTASSRAYSTSLATLYDGYEPCLQLPCEMEHGNCHHCLSTMEGNAQQNGVSWRRSQKRRNCISMKATNFKNAGEETWNCTFYIISLVFASPIFTNHLVLPSVHLSIRPSMSVYSTHSPCLYTVYVHRTPTHQRIHAPAKFGQRLEFIIPPFVAPLNKRSATEATTATHQARSADSSGTCLVASFCFTVYSMLSPKNQVFLTASQCSHDNSVPVYLSC